MPSISRAIAATIFLSFLFAVALAPSADAVQVFEKKADNFIILMDTSGTMADEYKDTGRTNMAVAKDILRQMNQEIPELGYNAALYAFAPKMKPYYAFQGYDRQAMARAIEELPESGSRMTPTPLGTALSEVEKMTENLQGRTVVYLFSDGRNTDGVDPVNAAEYLSQNNVCILVISLAETRTGRETLESIRTRNECSKEVAFDYASQYPQVCTGELCTVAFVEAEQTRIVKPTAEKSPFEDVETVQFGFDKAEITPEARAFLDDVGTYLGENDQARIYLAGYADNRGSDATNLRISRRRAMVVRNYLMLNHGVEPERFDVQYGGEEAPLAPNTTESGRAQNRRVEIIVMDLLGESGSSQ